MLPEVSAGINLTQQNKSVENAAKSFVSATLHYDGSSRFTLAPMSR